MGFFYKIYSLALSEDLPGLDERFTNVNEFYAKANSGYSQVTLKTSMGQALDVLLSKNFETTRKMNKFTMDRYKAIVKYKTAYYSFQLPVSLAMFMAGISDEKRHRQAKLILLEMGSYFQIQDDYLDCFGNMAEIGKSGTDIQDGKCTWLLVVALQRANAQQKEKLDECYGCNDLEKVEIVKNIYKEIGLPNIYAAFEEDTYNLLVTRIQQISRGLPHDVFFLNFR